MKNVMQRGFTLIELLVVIAIIGILAAVVLGSLNDARDGANDASAKTSINNIRNVAEVLYSENDFTYGTIDAAMADDGGGFTAVDPASSVCNSQAVIDLMQAANTQTRGVGECAADDSEYAVEVQMRDATEYFCVDSSGFSGESNGSVVTAATTGAVTECTGA